MVWKRKTDRPYDQLGVSFASGSSECQLKELDSPNPRGSSQESEAPSPRFRLGNEAFGRGLGAFHHQKAPSEGKPGQCPRARALR